ncbi:hypothetical protein [Undibacterium sp.]|uniref:hypothetical protein n=1 Tax=Undibacterium sp. TaxID=1914977 RepID=UPI00273138D5|nr:hypothetical protein [Undibacterium sp.]MDP1980502.1 hypothetical protein [Undibacterium sp.]
MTTAMQRVASKLGAGKRPTYSEMEAALQQSLQERNAFEQATFSMEKWIFALVSAHGHKDVLAVKAILDRFVQDNPALAAQIFGVVH